jgi:hypothetical protein
VREERVPRKRKKKVSSASNFYDGEPERVWFNGDEEVVREFLR